MSHADEQTQPRAALDALLIPGTDDDVRTLYQALAEAARDATLSLMEDDVIVVDTETTGLDPAYCSLIEIAALRMNGPDIVGRFQTFVNPGCSIPEEITELTGITNADIADAPSPREAVAAFAQFAGECDLIAHNAPFDLRVLASCLHDYHIDWQPEAAYLCTCQMGKRAYPYLPNHKLNTLCDHLQLSLDHHKAGSDSRACALLLLNYLEKGLQPEAFLRTYRFADRKTIPYCGCR